ncbi:MAG: hypothetical protein K8W52_15330 [Deltaproteobacteria bacterium]|nr:hypothetical protein [Deltaproteobacteria bacterium]
MCSLLGVFASTAHASSAPTGAHPRLFLDTDTVTAMKAAATTDGGPVARALAMCDDVIARPAQYTSGGYQGFNFADSMQACLIAYVVRGDAADAAAAVKYWKALLDDYTTLGDGAGGDNVVQHDGGYAMRVFGPNAAIAYDWLHDAPGVDDSLRAHARARFKAWTDWYIASGYHRDEPGGNYHAGYAFATAMIAIAEGGEAGADGDKLWTKAADQIFGVDIANAIAPGGVMEGGDWIEGWQYGALSVAEYALGARALRDNGAPLDGFAAWESAMAARHVYAIVPDGTAAYIGGDSDTKEPHVALGALAEYAVLLDAAPMQAKQWAANVINTHGLEEQGFLLFGALAQARTPQAMPFPADAPTWYYAAGSRTVYARSDWSAKAIWFVSQCAPQRGFDHMFDEAGGFVMSRGSDHLLVDPTPYGSLSSLNGNAPTVASPQLPAAYQPSQGFWGTDADVDFRWARQTKSGVVAARCDYTGAFRFQDTASDIPSAVRDFVMVPDAAGNATLVLIDDIVGSDTSRPMLLQLRSLGDFTGGGTEVARASVGGSDVVVQSAFATAGTANVDTPPVGDCYSGARGQCVNARFAVGEWKLQVPATHAQAVTVVDALAKGGTVAAATTSSGDGWRATELDRSGHLAVIAVDAGRTTITYTARPGRHVVVGAPASATGRADVTAVAASGGACTVTVAPHSGTGGLDARPAIFAVANDCGIVEDDTQGGFVPPDPNDPPPGSSVGGDLTGCGCGAQGSSSALPVAVIVGLALIRRRRRAI